MPHELSKEEIAIIGMACRVPGARNVDEFWKNVRDGVESIRPLNAEELSALDPDARGKQEFVNAVSTLDEAEGFDAAFFGIMPAEAALIDPQQRLFLECAWTALEHGGYDPANYKGAIGVFGGVARNTYLLSNIAQNSAAYNPTGLSQMWLGNDKDFVATRVAHKLDLRGPGVNVQSACSTSGVAIHLACQSLLSGECDMALAGGARIQVPLNAGYLFQEGGILSPDGRCRAFDARANGTVLGSGGAVVLLKRLSDALRDGDTIHAVIKGTAINNDGCAKAGFTAPGVKGQTACIADAHAIAEVDPDSISYIETHGTGTLLGDPIEIAALTQAFRKRTARKQFCAIGSVKSNIGHLDAGAGAIGVIKAALALSHRQLPPSMHFETPNPQIDFAGSPFFVIAKLSEWKSDGAPRRAGASSFGLGGTNAHIILEEPPREESKEPARPLELLPLSARTPEALAKAAANLASHFETNPNANLADAAFTLQTCRRAFDSRAFVVCRDAADAVARLKSLKIRRESPQAGPRIVFMFPGGGAQYPAMARGIYENEPYFREQIDACLSMLDENLRAQVREALFPDAGREADAAELLEKPGCGLPALFIVEQALARLWMSWGIRPAAMIGHSMGEYTAACIAGVVSLADALKIVSLRGRLFETVAPGAMLSVPLAENEIAPLLKRCGDQLSISAHNAPSLCVVSGPVEQIDSLQHELEEKNVDCVRLKITVAAHSALLDPILPEFEAFLRTIRFSAPEIPYVSNVTGKFITAAEASNPLYFAKHLRQPVRFADGLGELLAQENSIFLECGPGRTLTSLLAQHDRRSPQQSGLNALRHPKDQLHDFEFILETLGKLWRAGAQIDFRALHRDRAPRRIPLPTYAFERKRCWVEPDRAVVKIISSNHDNPQAKQMDNAKTGPTVQSAIEGELKRILHELSGLAAEDLASAATFFELGFDSLFLTRATQAFEKRFGVRVTFRQLLEQLSSIGVLAEHLAQTPSVAAQFAAPPIQAQPVIVETISTPQPAANASEVESIIQQQLQLMARQLELLKGAPQAKLQTHGPEGHAAHGPEARATTPAAHGPFVPLNRSGDNSLTPRQQRHLDDLIARYTRKTAKSKELAQNRRAQLADPRAISGFRQAWKEMNYPTTAVRSNGSRVWDVDGNEYVDFVMGYGVNLFGHSPKFIQDVLGAQINSGFAIGPQWELTGEIAALFCELTGCERMTFCNTGSEAVLAAMRAARTVTGRPKIALFADSYHGMFDEVLVRAATRGKNRAALPIAPGIPLHSGNDVIVLEYGNPESLQQLKEHAGEIAAVLVEPVQSKHLNLQPREFLHELRALTKETGIALVFDEMISGFRAHPGGAQGYFGVQADLAAYGKVAGGGMPIGILGGKAEFMAALDGGLWNFGDSSAPEATLTYFAGTFVRHPLSLAAAYAALLHLKEQGPALQENLNTRTAKLAQSLAAFVSAEKFPLSVEHFSSVFKISWPADQHNVPLLYYHMRLRGIDTWERRNCFVTTAHSDADLNLYSNAFRESLLELREGGFFTDPSGAGTSVFKDHPAKTSATFALTAGQKEVWLACRMSADSSCCYNESTSLRLRGELNLAAFRAALEKLNDRHEALRTTISADGETQTVQSSLPVDLAEIDLSACDQHEQQRRVSEVFAEEGRDAFDLSSGPLWRTKVIRLNQREQLVVITLHHLAADGSSIGTLLRELGVFYAAAVNRTDPALDPALQFRQFAQMQLEHSSSTHADESYWLQQFASPPAPLNLPLDHPRPTAKTYRSALERATIDADTATAIKHFSAGHRCTLFVTFFAAYQSLLQRLCAQDDFVIGVPAAGQSQAGSGPLVGHCINLLPIRARVNPDSTFSEHLAAARKVVLDAFDHQSATFGTLLEKLPLPRDPSRTPLVEAVFNFEKAERAEFPLLEVELQPLPKPCSNFDLFLNIRQSDSGFELVCNFNSDLFENATIQRWLGHFSTLLAGIVADADCCVSELPLLNEHERAELLNRCKQTQVELPAGIGVHHLVEAQAARDPNALAIACGAQRVNYGELNARANQLAKFLRERGTKSETLIAVCLPRSAELLVAVLGIWKAGGAFVPLDPEHPRERIEAVLQDAQSLLVITTQVLRDKVQFNHAAVCIDDEALFAGDSSNVQGEFSQDQLAYVMFTSGSTGKPKGVQIEHRGLLNLVNWHRRTYALTPADRGTQVASPVFDASLFEIWPLLASGASIHIPDDATRKSPKVLLDYLAREKITVAFMPTPLAEAVLDEIPPPDLSLRAMFTGGDRLRSRPRAVHNFEFFDHYGPTENSIVTTSARVAKSGEAEGLPLIGLPIDNNFVYVLDAQMQPVPPGVPGELHAGGAGVARGYLNQPELDAGRFVANPFGNPLAPRLYKTGDLVRMRANGEFEFLGRIDRQLKVRGFRIEPAEIETALCAHAGVSEAVVVLQGETLAAFVTLRNKIEICELRRHLVGRLPEYMIPAVIQPIAEMPLNSSGKIDRNGLPKIAAAPSVFVAPRTPAEEKLANIWSDVLKRGEIGIDDNFFELGGHSLLAARVLTRLQSELGAQLPLRSIFDHPTVASFARHLDSARTGKTAAVTRRDPRQPIPLSSAQQRLWFVDQFETNKVAANVFGSFRIRGALNHAALERALGEIVQRHEILRTVFVSPGGQPRQLIHRSAPTPIPLTDLTELTQPQQEAELKRIASRELRRPFDLGTLPLFRTALFRVGSEHVLFFTAHHIIFDGWSQDVFLRELQTLHDAFLKNENPSLPELSVQYADYAAWQQRFSETGEHARQIEFWRNQLRGPLPSIYVEPDFKRGLSHTRNGARLLLSIPETLTEKLTGLGRAQNLTTFNILLAALKLVLARRVRGNDITVGIPVAGRTQIEFEPLIGCFLNTLPLRTKLDPAASLRETLTRVRETILAAQANQDVAFQELVKEMRTPREHHVTPFFQVFFSMSASAACCQAADSAISIAELPLLEDAEPKFDLSIYAAERGAQINLTAIYDAALLKPETVAAILDEMLEILRQLPDSLERPVSEFIAAGANAALLAGFNEPIERSASSSLTKSLIVERKYEHTPPRAGILQ